MFRALGPRNGLESSVPVKILTFWGPRTLFVGFLGPGTAFRLTFTTGASAMPGYRSALTKVDDGDNISLVNNNSQTQLLYTDVHKVQHSDKWKFNKN